MSIVIHVYDDLARRLQSEAESQNLSVEDLAVRILDSAVSQSCSGADWGQHNRRRLELIRKSIRHELTEREQAELDDLQSSLDERFESFDAGLLAELSEMKATVARLDAEQSHD
ncbi:MAG: hypothetical protein HUU20_18825 [Pirellulales bacterium]|nr:hypothetical protein [Pirellulales bacterium]